MGMREGEEGAGGDWRPWVQREEAGKQGRGQWPDPPRPGRVTVGSGAPNLQSTDRAILATRPTPYLAPASPQPPQDRKPPAKEEDRRNLQPLPPLFRTTSPPSCLPQVPGALATPPHAWHQLPLLRDQHRPWTAWRMLR